MSYVLSFIGYVSIICNYNPESEKLFCNSPAGVDIVAIDQYNNRRLLDSVNGPVSKIVRYDVSKNETIVVIPRVSI